jgi:hypothetical protein
MSRVGRVHKPAAHSVVPANGGTKSGREQIDGPGENLDELPSDGPLAGSQDRRFPHARMKNSLLQLKCVREGLSTSDGGHRVAQNVRFHYRPPVSQSLAGARSSYGIRHSLRDRDDARQFHHLTEQMSRMAMTSVAQFSQKTAGGARSPTQTMRATSFVSIVDLFA